MANRKSSRQRTAPNKPRPSRDRSPFHSGDVRSSSFWSYVRDDDTALFGKIGELRDDIRRVYKLMTGDAIEIFMDRDDIGWGQQWSQVISRGITRTVFMLPVVTPSYFRSDACRDELLKFNSICAQRGLSELILPIVLSGIERISSESDDEVVRIIAGTQYEDFSDVWPYARGGEEWMLAVRRLVTGLIDAEKRIDERLFELLNEQVAYPDGPQDPDEIPDSERGIAEYMVEIMPAIEAAAEALGVAGEKFQAFADTVTSTPLGNSPDGSNDPRRFQAQIATTANGIKDSAAALETAGAAALEKTSDADQLITAMIQSMTGMNDKSFLTAFQSSMGDTSSVRDTVEMMDEMIRQISDLERISSVLRKELKPARRGIQFIRDAGRLFLQWSAT